MVCHHHSSCESPQIYFGLIKGELFLRRNFCISFCYEANPRPLSCIFVRVVCCWQRPRGTHLFDSAILVYSLRDCVVVVTVRVRGLGTLSFYPLSGKFTT